MMFSSRHRWAWRQTLVGVLAFFTLPSLLMGDEPMSDPPAPQVAKVRIVLAGDSTVANGQGWGPAFAKLLADRVESINLARNGRSSKSFYNEGLWAKCLEAKSDYILIQFGHNDQPGKGPDRETDAQTTYRQNMARYVDQSRAAGSIPILVTSLSRREFGADGKIHSALVPYVEVVKQLAQEKNVPLVDLHARSIELYERLGEKACAELSPSPTGAEPDRTHLSAKGGEMIAPLVVEELKKAVPLLAESAVGQDQPATQPVLSKHQIAAGPFEPTWESLAKNYHCPQWFRDAKFGIWAHWTAQCVPEQGDWYARKMYIQGDEHNKFHVEHYGHPSQFGFKDIDNLWHAENWDPEKLMQLYKAAGAKFFVALANHHDNFDCYDSKYHDWNSVRVGPHKDIVGTWAKVVRENGLRFGVSNHSAHAWHWFQPAYGYDPEGPQAGVRYDALLTKADGQGKWWEGLDPQELYTGPNMVLPDGLKTIKEAQAWHEQHDRKWTESPPADNPQFVDNWFLRCQDLVDKYYPDLIYLDNTQLPLGQAGLDIAAHYYNTSLAKNGKLEAVLTAKKLKPDQRLALVEDYERGAAGDIQPLPWQTCSCIGNWHYKRGIKYKTVGQVVHMLVDIVSKNGCLLLSIPLRGDGTIDDEELAFLQGMARWMAVNGEGIFETRPWKVFGEGPHRTAGGMFNEGKINYGPQDIRFTTKDGALYVYVLGEPKEDVSIKSLGLASEHAKPVAEIKLLGSDEPMHWNQSQEALVITRPERLPCAEAIAFKVTFK